MPCEVVINKSLKKKPVSRSSMNNLKTGTASEASEEHLIRKYLPSVNLLTKGSTLAEFTSGSEENSLIILSQK